MSEEVRQFLEIVAERFELLEARKMVEQGRVWCDHCHAWTFPRNDLCGLCHAPYLNLMGGTL